MDLFKRRVTVMGLGRHGGGAAAARWLAERGALVTATDLAGEADLHETVAALVGASIHAWRLGEHREDDFSQAEIVIVNPAVRPADRFVEAARRAGATITSETELFLSHCPARVVGVTGSNGKSTVASMIAAIAAADGRRTWLGGNIGVSLLPALAEIQHGDVVALELSSFQLHWLSAGCRMPEVAVVVNCTPNHLDWHGDVAHYRAVKQRLLTGQRPGDVAVLNPGDGESWSWRALIRGGLMLPADDDRIPPLAVPGEHNRVNARLAAAAARAVGCANGAVDRALQMFAPLEHRQNMIAEIAGRTFVDDSKATTPEAVVAALAASELPTWLLAGGVAKGSDFSGLASAALERCRGVALFGASRVQVRQAILERAATAALLGRELPCDLFDDLAQALDWCWRNALPGERILLSPGCASFDQFRDFQDRGQTFRRLVETLRATSVYCM